MVDWEAMEEVVMADMVEVLVDFSQEPDKRLPKEVQEAHCYHKGRLEEQVEVLEELELEPECRLECLLFLRLVFQEGLLEVQERKLPKCQVWVCLDFTKVDWCQEKDLVDVEFCLGWPLELT